MQSSTERIRATSFWQSQLGLCLVTFALLGCATTKRDVARVESRVGGGGGPAVIEPIRIEPDTTTTSAVTGNVAATLASSAAVPAVGAQPTTAMPVAATGAPATVSPAIPQPPAVPPMTAPAPSIVAAPTVPIMATGPTPFVQPASVSGSSFVPAPGTAAAPNAMVAHQPAGAMNTFPTYPQGAGGMPGGVFLSEMNFQGFTFHPRMSPASLGFSPMGQEPNSQTQAQRLASTPQAPLLTGTKAATASKGRRGEANGAAVLKPGTLPQAESSVGNTPPMRRLPLAPDKSSSVAAAKKAGLPASATGNGSSSGLVPPAPFPVSKVKPAAPPNGEPSATVSVPKPAGAALTGTGN